MSTLFFNPDNSEFLSIYFDLLWERIANFSISKDQSIPKIDRVKDLKQAGTILLNHLKI